MAVNRLSTKNRTPLQALAGFSTQGVEKLPVESHEALEVSLCDEGMCFSSRVQHEIGVVLLVDFEPDAKDNDNSLRSEAVVVDCQPSPCGRAYDITVLFTGN